MRDLTQHPNPLPPSYESIYGRMTNDKKEYIKQMKNYIYFLVFLSILQALTIIICLNLIKVYCSSYFLACVHFTVSSNFGVDNLFT